MPITPTGEIGSALAAIPAMLADCATFRALMGAADAAAALARGRVQAEIDAGPVPGWTAVVGEPAIDRESATQTDRSSFQLNVVVEWPVETETGDTALDVSLRAVARWDSLRTEVAALMGTGAYPRRLDRQWHYPVRTGADDPERGDRWSAEVIFSQGS